MLVIKIELRYVEVELISAETHVSVEYLLKELINGYLKNPFVYDTQGEVTVAEMAEKIVIKEKFVEKVTIKHESGDGLGVRHLQMMCMFLCTLTLYMGRGCMSVAVLAMTDQSRRSDTDVTIFDWDKKTQGIILSSFFWGYVVTQFPAGILSKKFGGKIIFLVALLVNGVLCLLLPTLAQLGDWSLVCAARAAMGLTQGCLYPSTHTLIGRWLPAHERDFMTGIVYGGVPLGSILAMSVSGLLAGTAVGWKLIFYVQAGLMFGVAVMWQLLTASTPSQHRMISDEERRYIEKGFNSNKNEHSIPWAQIIKTKSLWAIMVTHTATTIVFTMFFVDIPTYLEKGLHLSLGKSAGLSSLPFIGMWLSCMISTWISQKLTNNNILSIGVSRKLFNSIGAFGGAVGLIGLSFMDRNSPNLIITILVASLTIAGFASAGSMLNLLDLSPTYAGIMLGCSNTASNTGSLITPLFISMVLRNDPTNVDRWRVLFIVFAVMSVIANIIYIVFSTSNRQDWDNPDFFDKKNFDPEALKPVLEKVPVNEPVKDKN